MCHVYDKLTTHTRYVTARYMESSICNSCRENMSEVKPFCFTSRLFSRADRFSAAIAEESHMYELAVSYNFNDV